MNGLKHFHLVHDLAENMLRSLPACAERSASLRKLPGAKDCFVWARLERSPDWEPENEQEQGLI